MKENFEHQLIKDEQGMLEFSNNFAMHLAKGDILHLIGDIGVGKTFFTRGLLKSLGCLADVTSPTFSLVESYDLVVKQEPVTFHHFDLYRLEDPYELELIGFRDYFDRDSIVVIEWPEKAQGFLPKANYELRFEMRDNFRQVNII